MRITCTAALAATLATLLTGTLAVAGGPDGLECPNACPLAKGANALRTNGSEGLGSSDVVRHDVRREILDSLDRV